MLCAICQKTCREQDKCVDKCDTSKSELPALYGGKLTLHIIPDYTIPTIEMLVAAWCYGNYYLLQGKTYFLELVGRKGGAKYII